MCKLKVWTSIKEPKNILLKNGWSDWAHTLQVKFQGFQSALNSQIDVKTLILHRSFFKGRGIEISRKKYNEFIDNTGFLPALTNYEGKERYLNV